MDFQGNNTLELTQATMKALLTEHLSDAFKAPTLRVTSIRVKGFGEAEVGFTTDPKPATEEA